MGINMESKYKSLAEWRKSDKSAYNSARYYGLLPEICDKFGWDHYYEGCRTYTYGNIGKVIKTFKTLLNSKQILRVEFSKGNYFIITNSTYDFLEKHEKHTIIWNGKRLIPFGISKCFKNKDIPLYGSVFNRKVCVYYIPFTIFRRDDSAKTQRTFSKVADYNNLMLNILEEKFKINYV